MAISQQFSMRTLIACLTIIGLFLATNKRDVDEVAVTIKSGTYQVGIPVELFVRNGESVELLVE